MKKFLLIALIVALAVPAFAIDKNGLLGLGAKAFYWVPMGDFGNAYDGSFGGGAKVSYGLADQMEAFGEFWYGAASFNEDFWGDNAPEDVDTTYYLTTFQIGARFNFSPYSEFDPYIQAAGGYYTWQYYTVTDDGGQWGDASDDKFGINLRAGAEYFFQPNMSLDIGVDYNSIFNVTVPVKDWIDDSDHSQGWNWLYEEQTVSAITAGLGVNIYF
ncbi:MAG: outer membrane beta-barrel protein [Candidatus Coatesbacteria bacterium]|nr:outer membrane beta-barrel protein [Candidatus Coatesbacteria bacterium]